MMMIGASLALLSAVLLSAHAQQGSTTTQYYPYFESLAVCAPVNVLINQSADSRYSITLEADPAVRQALVFDYDGGKGLGIESVGSFKSSNPIKITISLPPGVLQYVELDYTNSDITIDVPFSLSKGEIANNGNGRVIVTRGLDGGLAKISSVGCGAPPASPAWQYKRMHAGVTSAATAHVDMSRAMHAALRRSGDVLMRGKATYSEVFSAGSGNRYVSGFQGQLNIKHDGNGTFTVDPMTGGCTVACACGMHDAELA
jgi:hypothetical protein